jgi:hypothetical protein
MAIRQTGLRAKKRRRRFPLMNADQEEAAANQHETRESKHLNAEIAEELLVMLGRVGKKFCRTSKASTLETEGSW